MMPAMRQRLLISAATVVAAFLWLWPASMLGGHDGSGGIALTSAGVSMPVAVLLMIAASLPVLAVAVLCGSAGNPLAGVFVYSASLCILAGVGGASDGWLRRATIPGGYRQLMLEAVLWFAWLVAGLLVIHRVRPGLRPKLGLMRSDESLGEVDSLTLPPLRAVPAAVLCAAASGALAHLLIRSSDSGQVIGSLILAFAGGATLAHMLFPQRSQMAILLSPLIVALASYGWTLGRFDSADHLLAAWYSMSDAWTRGPRLSGLAACLPIHYASAAVCGCSLGVGMAQAMEAARKHALAAAQD